MESRCIGDPDRVEMTLYGAVGDVTGAVETVDAGSSVNVVVACDVGPALDPRRRRAETYRVGKNMV